MFPSKMPFLNLMTLAVSAFFLLYKGGNIMEKILTEVFGIWYLIGAAFVFFMQAGFAMVEAGFTRAKNAGNIIMKNLMDFCLGTVAFLIIGYN